MKLKVACEIAESCGLSTIGEAVDNIEHMVMSLFVYKDIPTQIEEIYLDPL